MRYLEDMRKATLVEFDKEEAEWRETAERQVLHLCEIEDPLPTPEELDELDPDASTAKQSCVLFSTTVSMRLIALGPRLDARYGHLTPGAGVT